MKSIELKGTQVFGVRRLTSEALPYDKESKLKGQKYHRYRYNGTVFTVNENDPFVKAHEEGNIREIYLLESERTNDADEKVVSFELDYCVTNNQAFGVAEFDAKILALTNVIAKPISVAQLEELA